MTDKILKFPTACSNILPSEAMRMLLTGKVMIGATGYAYMVRTGSGMYGPYETYFYHIGSWCVCYNLPCEWWREATPEEKKQLISKELQDVLDASYKLEEAGRECQAMDTVMFKLEELMSEEKWDDASALINAVDFDRVKAATVLVILSLVRLDKSFKAREAAFYQRAQEHIKKLYPDRHTELLQGLQ